MQTDVVTYKDRKLFERDVRRRASIGWTVGTTMENRPRSGCGRFLMMGGIGALVFPPKPEITVTYARTAEAAAIAAENATAVAVAERAERQVKGRRRARRWLYVLGGMSALTGLITVIAGSFVVGLMTLIPGLLLILWGWHAGEPSHQTPPG